MSSSSVEASKNAGCTVDPRLYASNPDHPEAAATLKKIDRGHRNRLATLVWSLAEPAGGGGETHFPRSGGLPLPATYRCNETAVGLKVEPKLGSAVMFYNLRPDGGLEPFSLHGGCPPAAGGTKLAINQWLWTRRYRGDAEIENGIGGHVGKQKLDHNPYSAE